MMVLFVHKQGDEFTSKEGASIHPSTSYILFQDVSRLYWSEGNML